MKKILYSALIFSGLQLVGCGEKKKEEQVQESVENTIELSAEKMEEAANKAAKSLRRKDL